MSPIDFASSTSVVVFLLLFFVAKTDNFDIKDSLLISVICTATLTLFSIWAFSLVNLFFE